MKVTVRLLLISILCFLISSETFAQEDKPCKSENKKADRIFENAKEQFKKGIWGDAYLLSKKTLEEDPDFAEAYYMMGVINFKRKDPNYTVAESNFRKALELCPDFPEHYIYYYLGKKAYSDHNYNDAILFLEKFLKDVDKVKTDKDYDEAESMLKFTKFDKKMIEHPVPFDPQPVPGLCSRADEYLPIISADDKMALFTRVVNLPPDKNSVTSSPIGRMKERFMFSRRENGVFDGGQEMPFPFNQNDNEGGATLTVDNKQLYYTLCKYTGGGKYYNCDICYSEYRWGQWTEITNLGSKVNRADTWESQPSISSDGKTLYFVSDRKGGYGGYDIYKTTKDDKGEWTDPVNLGPTINTPGNEKAPFIHPDNRTFYFSSDGHLGMGGYDIFYSRLDENGNFSKPINLGYPINTPDDDVGFFVSTDGHFGYFASNKYKGLGGWDIFYFDLYPEARPEQVLMVKGELKDKETNTPVKAKIELKNATTKKVTEIQVDSITGEYAGVVVFRNDFIMTVKKEGYGYESRYISRHDSVVQIPVLQVDFEIKPLEVGQAYKLNDIYFATDKYDLTEESKLVIDGFHEFLDENPKIKVSIEGYTDDVGKPEYNRILSENRARSVYDYLISKDIPPARLTFKGFGQGNPVASNATAEGKAKNRRTVFVIMEK